MQISRKFYRTQFCLILLVFSTTIYSQSNRVKNTPTPTPIPYTDSISSDEIKKYLGNEFAKNPAKYKYLIARGVEEFILKLNLEGRKGYKLDKIIRLPQGSNYGGESGQSNTNSDNKFSKLVVAGILKYDGEIRHEYNYFFSPVPEYVLDRFNEFKKRGFYYADSLPIIDGYCGIDNEEPKENQSEIERQIETGMRLLTEVVWGNIYIVERKRGIKNLSEYDVIYGTLGFGKSPTTELQTKLDEHVKRGFYPVTMGVTKTLNDYDFIIVLKKDAETNPDVAGRTYKFFKTESNFRKKLSNESNQGFQIGYIGQFGANNFALLYKEEGQNPKKTYDWEHTVSKKIDKKITKAVAKGGIYKDTISQTYGCDYAAVRLLFEQDVSKPKSIAEYKTLFMTDKFNEPWSNESPENLIQPSNNAYAEFERMLNEGFTIRTMYFNKGVGILFEKK